MVQDHNNHILHPKGHIPQWLERLCQFQTLSLRTKEEIKIMSLGGVVTGGAGRVDGFDIVIYSMLPLFVRTSPFSSELSLHHEQD
jgi:hypothetical protein